MHSAARGMRLLGYLRVSTQGQVDDGAGLDTQRDAIRTWAKARGHRVGWLADEGISGSNGVETRAALAEALERIKDGRAQGIVVYKLDRLARSLVLQEQILDDVRRRGGQVFSCSDTECAYLEDPGADPDPTRTLVRQVLGAVSEYERAMVRARMAAGTARKKANGGYAYGQPPYGWGSDGHGNLVPVPAEQSQIDLMRALREAGTSYRGIVALLDQAQVPARRGKWHPETVRRILVSDAG